MPIECLNQKDFSKEEEKYRNLLRKELRYCNRNISKIRKLANDVYKLGAKEENRKKYNICDFKKLEDKCIEFMNLKNV